MDLYLVKKQEWTSRDENKPRKVAEKTVRNQGARETLGIKYRLTKKLRPLKQVKG